MTMLQEAIEDLKVRALGKKIGDEEKQASSIKTFQEREAARNAKTL